MRILPIAACGWLLAAAAMAQTPGWGLAQLMQAMATVKSASAQFSESKTMKLLSTRLQASGTLSYVAPDYIRKRTEAPVQEDFVLRQGEITLTGPGNAVHHFSVSQAPEIGGLAEGIRGTLAGDLPALQKYYALSFSGGPAGWQLVLRPKDAGLQRLLAWMAIRGVGNRITEIDTASADGGHSEMHVREDSVVAH